VSWFNRLKVQGISRITMNGRLVCAGKNSGIPPFNDNDWTFNLGELIVIAPVAGLSVEDVRTRAAPGSGLAQAFASFDSDTHEPILHCEIGSHIGDFAAVGTAVGATIGALAAAALCIAAGWFTFGLACLFALILAPIIGGSLGDWIGSGLGWIADQLDDFDHRGESVSKSCVVNFNGRWVTDIGHQHNEIHDIDSIQIIECGEPARHGPVVSGAVGIGRMPTGVDP
jgi:hypothetical protein